MNAKISATPIVVVNGSPIPSVTGLLPSGAFERRAIALCNCGLTAASALRVAGVAPLPGRSSVPTTLCSCVATVRALCCTVYVAPSGPLPFLTCFCVCVESGLLMIFSSAWFCHMHRPKATASAAREMIKRTRSSVRCSTTLIRSSCPMLAAAVAISAQSPWLLVETGLSDRSARLADGHCDGDGLGHCRHRRGSGNRGRRVVVDGQRRVHLLAAQRLLEAAHA